MGTESLQVLTYSSRSGNFVTETGLHQGSVTFTPAFVPTDPTQPGSLTIGVTIDVTPQAAVTGGGFVYNRRTHQVLQTITITNTGSTPILGRISLVLDGLPAGISLFNTSGTTQQLPLAGSPYIDLAGPTSSLAPGQSLSIVLEFVDPSLAPILYTTRVLSGNGQR